MIFNEHLALPEVQPLLVGISSRKTDEKVTTIQDNQKTIKTKKYEESFLVSSFKTTRFTWIIATIIDNIQYIVKFPEMIRICFFHSVWLCSIYPLNKFIYVLQSNINVNVVELGKVAYLIASPN